MHRCSAKLPGCRRCKFLFLVAVDPIDALSDIEAALEAVEGARLFSPPPSGVAAHVVVSPGAASDDRLAALLIRTPTMTQGPTQLNEVGVTRLSPDQLRLDFDNSLFVNHLNFKFCVMVGHSYHMVFN